MLVAPGLLYKPLSAKNHTRASGQGSCKGDTHSVGVLLAPPPPLQVGAWPKPGRLPDSWCEGLATLRMLCLTGGEWSLPWGLSNLVGLEVCAWRAECAVLPDQCAPGAISVARPVQ